MRKLVAHFCLTCTLASGLSLLSAAGPASAQDGAFAPPGRPTFDIRMARITFQTQAQTPDAGGAPASPAVPGSDDLEEEDFDDYLDAGPATGDDDPLEHINRPIFDFNLTLDRWVLRPITRIYIETVPAPGRTGVSNMLSNIKAPVVLANDLLQGEMSRAGATFGRFFINTFFGLGGLFDTAGALGLPGHDEDFGQTLASYGVGGSPYLVLPFFGPSNPRDALGDAVDLLFDPMTFLAPTDVKMARTGTGVVSDRAALLPESEALEATSIDFYAAVRSLYYQNREFEISNDKEGVKPLSGATTQSPAAVGAGASDALDSFE